MRRRNHARTIQRVRRGQRKVAREDPEAGTADRRYPPNRGRVTRDQARCASQMVRHELNAGRSTTLHSQPQSLVIGAQTHLPRSCE